MNMRAVLIVFAALLFGGYKAVERFPEYLGPLPAWSAIQTIEGPVTHVRDGDTIEVAGKAIRLGSLDCAEQGTQAGSIATERMRELVSGVDLTCFLNGRTTHDRAIGSCVLPDGVDLGRIMIEEKTCRQFW